MPGIIDGRKWIEERRRHLKAALDNNPTDEERKAIEAELEKLDAEAKSSHRRFRRWIFWGGRPPEV
jgi:hypothetical protein